MSTKKQNPPKPKTIATPIASDGLQNWRLFLWLAFFANTIFILPNCLDLGLSTRFFFLSLALLASIGLLWRDLRERADWRWHSFDLLFVLWYGLNIASVFWASNWSEAVFFTQKVLLGFLMYWLFRQALHRDAGMVRRTVRQASLALTFIVGGIILVQLGQAVGKVGLNNEALYDYAKALHGNKGLASDLLFFLLIFNALSFRETKMRGFALAACSLLLGLILVLQTRTVYLAVAAGGLLYFPLRAAIEPGFRSLFFKRILPGGSLAIALLAALVAWKGRGTSLAERLNPMTYLESASASERRFVWWKTDLLNADNPWLGVGNGSWKIHFPKKSLQGAYRLQEKNIIFTRAHNDYLEVRAEMGLVGVTLFIALFAAAFLAVAWGLRRAAGGQLAAEDPAEAAHDLLVMGIGLLGYCIIQYFDFPRERIEMQVILSMYLGWIVWLTRDFWAKAPGFSVQKIGSTVLGICAIGLIFNVVIGWNRIIGEIHNVKILEAQGKNDWRTVLREAQASENKFYEFNDVALPIRWYQGVAQFQLGDYRKSAEAFSHAYALNPWSFQVINNYASALVKTGDIQAAIKLYEKTLEINPKYDEGKFNLSYSYYQLGDYRKSLDYALSVDTIPGARTPDELKKNKAILEKQREFLRQIEMKTGGAVK